MRSRAPTPYNWFSRKRVSATAPARTSATPATAHFLHALTANARDEVAATHPGIQVSLVSPGVVRTPFGVNAVHGGVDSRVLPNSQSADEVAAVIAGVIASRRPDVYTRPGARQMMLDYLGALTEDAGQEAPR